jgi:hypothetical protein
MQVEIRKPAKDQQRYGVRIYGYVFANAVTDLFHRVVFVRKTGMRRWLCDCPAQLFIETGRRRNCKHTRAVRRKVGV